MSTQQSISGLNIGDGAGGNVALSLQEKVMRILRMNSFITFLSARSTLIGEMGANGTTVFYKPELMQSKGYAVGQNINEVPQIPLIELNMKTLRTLTYEIEEIDEQRLSSAGALEGVIAEGVANSILADQEAHFYMGLRDEINADATKQILLPKLGEVDCTPAEAKAYFKQIKFAHVEMTQLFNRQNLGVEGNEIFALYAPKVIPNLVDALTTGNAGDRAIGLTLTGGREIRENWGINYLQVGMLNINVPKGQSWAQDYDYNMSNVLGFLLHLEAAAFPTRMVSVKWLYNTSNGNRRYISKYMFGFKVIRPELVRGLYIATPTI